MNAFKLVGRGRRKVLMLSGLLGNQHAFDRGLAYADLDLFQYAVMDYRGFGGSAGEAGLHTVHEASMDAVYLSEYLGWSSFTVLGHSLGALVAQMVALAKPRSVRHIVSVAGLGAGGLRADAARRQLLDAAAESIDARTTMVNAGTASRYSRAACRAIASATLASTRPEAFRGLVSSASLTDVSAQVRASPTPISVIVGSADPAASAEAAKSTTLAWYPKAALTVLDGGHYLPDEAPLAMMTAIEKALA